MSSDAVRKSSFSSEGSSLDEIELFQDEDNLDYDIELTIDLGYGYLKKMKNIKGKVSQKMSGKIQNLKEKKQRLMSKFKQRKTALVEKSKTGSFHRNMDKVVYTMIAIGL